MTTIVGVTVGARQADLVLSRHYVDAVLAAGGLPLLLPVSHGTPCVLLESVAMVDALILTSGGDIEPHRYGATVTATLDGTDADRDHLEILAFHAAHDTGRRVLGVCRGAQLMAVASGGTLVQDLPAQGHSSHRAVGHDGRDASVEHPLKAEPGSVVARLLGSSSHVNSHHHQAIDSPGPALTPTAWSDDGVIEALEGEHMLGLQWHPELMFARDRAHLRPFEWVVSGLRGLDQ